MKKHTFYHAGCTVCVSAENELLALISPEEVEIVHLGESKEKIKEAKAQGVESVPALLTKNDQVLHINFGASIDDL